MTDRLARLFAPDSLAVIGGGAWCEQVIHQARKMGFAGDIWPVHPSRPHVEGIPAFPGIADLPSAPDAAFVGVNRDATIGLVAKLAENGAGGAVCFASGFRETGETGGPDGDLQAQLLKAAGQMPILGPNCYGFINALDRALLWPDQHGCRPVDTGVAILTQSSNVSINLSMQKRALPIAYMIACGNMAQTSQAEIALHLLDDDRVTAMGLHVEGFLDLRAWEDLAKKAFDKGVPLIALKVGDSAEARQAAISHTASLAGGEAGARAFLARLGIAQVKGLPAFLETLKLLHCYGPLPNGNIASISCSGGEAGLIADLAQGHDLAFPPLADSQTRGLRDVLGSRVAISNPLDYQTYIWRDTDAMTKAWAAMTGGEISMTLSVVDYPTSDASDWVCATEAALRVRRETGARFGVVASLPELMPEDIARQFLAEGVVPLSGLEDTLTAIEAAAQIRPPHDIPVHLPTNPGATRTLLEYEAKLALRAHDVPIPNGCLVTDETDISAELQHLTAPYAIKRCGEAHKSEHDAIRLNIGAEDAADCIQAFGGQVLVEEMVTDAIAELLVGVTLDPAHGFVLTLGAGGVLTEVIRDHRALLLPASTADIESALKTLRYNAVLEGYRGRPPVDLASVIRAIKAVETYVLANADSVVEVEINPLICTASRAVAADALIRKA